MLLLYVANLHSRTRGCLYCSSITVCAGSFLLTLSLVWCYSLRARVPCLSYLNLWLSSTPPFESGAIQTTPGEQSAKVVKSMYSQMSCPFHCWWPRCVYGKVEIIPGYAHHFRVSTFRGAAACIIRGKSISKQTDVVARELRDRVRVLWKWMTSKIWPACCKPELYVSILLF